jgi:hypothetical protein
MILGAPLALTTHDLALDLKHCAAEVWLLGPLSAILKRITWLPAGCLFFSRRRPVLPLPGHLEKNILLVRRRQRPYNGIKDALSGSGQRTTPPPLRGEMVFAQDRAAYANRLPHDCQVSRRAGCEGRSPPVLMSCRTSPRRTVRCGVGPLRRARLTMASDASFTPSAWLNPTATKCIRSSLIARRCSVLLRREP